jgi:hypothetical protein
LEKQRNKIDMKIAMYDLEGNLLELFEELETVRELEIRLNYSLNSIHNVIKGTSHQSKGRQFLRFSDQSKFPLKVGDVTRLNSGMTYESIGKYYNDKFICSYGSLREASEKNNISSVKISQCCSGRRKTTNGFVFKKM